MPSGLEFGSISTKMHAHLLLQVLHVAVPYAATAAGAIRPALSAVRPPAAEELAQRLDLRLQDDALLLQPHDAGGQLLVLRLGRHEPRLRESVRRDASTARGRDVKQTCTRGWSSR